MTLPDFLKPANYHVTLVKDETNWKSLCNKPTLNIFLFDCLHEEGLSVPASTSEASDLCSRELTMNSYVEILW